MLTPFLFLLLYDLVMLVDYGVDKYDIGNGFGHFGVAVEDVSSLLLNLLLTVSSQTMIHALLYSSFIFKHYCVGCKNS